ncbi:MAG: 2,5-didehydrogluconate reductase [Thermomicrobiales bacterium]|nr:2,5-didehydrogluconate reductase [Thermomicrobiales bacterium]
MAERRHRIAGVEVPPIGQGTWRMGDDPSHEVLALRTGIDLGMTLIDTAELYGNGKAEEVVAEAVRGRRDEVFIVSKVLPTNATTAGTVRSCEASLKRLGTDRIDLYLLHWRREVPLAETVAGFEQLVAAGKIRAWGVSNFNVGDIESLPNGSVPASNQILYNLTRRGPEADLLPHCAAAGISVMAYSPIEKGRLLEHPAIVQMALERSATPAQVALAWAIRDRNIVAIPKASSLEHVRQNAAALDLVLSEAEIGFLNEAFPAPGVIPLQTLS